MIYENLNIISLSVILMVLFSCEKSSSTSEKTIKIQIIEAESDLQIGLPDQPLENQFGQPIAVRTDALNNIYIADRQSKTIKVFDNDGRYLKSLGGRGRGPAEFQEMEFMELTPEGHLVLMDRGNLEFKVISTEGKQIASYPYNLSDQFYPQSVRYTDDWIFALFFNSSSSLNTPLTERKLFHISQTDFQKRDTSFFQINQIVVDYGIRIALMTIYPGSFVLSDDHTLYFSPGTYDGTLFMYRQSLSGVWSHEKIFSGKLPLNEAYKDFEHEQQYNEAAESGLPRIVRSRYNRESVYGKQLSMDAGIYELSDGRIIHFYAVLGDEKYRLPEGTGSHPMDLYVQIFNKEGDLLEHSFLFTYTEQYHFPRYKLVNWKDEHDRFYMIDHPGEYPVIRRFSLKLPG